MTRAVLDVAHEVGTRAGQVEDAPDDVEVLALLAADVVRIAGLALAQRELDARAVVVDLQPLAPLLPVAVDRQRLPVQRVRDEERQKLLRILARAVRVRAARHQRVDTVRPDVREHLQLATRLRRRVRAGRAQRCVLRARRRAERDVAVDLVGRHLHEPLAVMTRVVEQHLRAEHIREDEFGRPEDRAVDVGLGREVDDRVDTVRRPRDRLGIGDVAVVELVVDAVEVRPVARVGELVENDHLLAVHREPPGEVRADEPGTAGDEDLHAPSLARHSASPSRQCGSSGAPRSLRTTE